MIKLIKTLFFYFFIITLQLFAEEKSMTARELDEINKIINKAEVSIMEVRAYGLQRFEDRKLKMQSNEKTTSLLSNKNLKKILKKRMRGMTRSLDKRKTNIEKIVKKCN